MSERQPGHYWITWSDLAEADVAVRKPGPLVAQWDGHVWWFVRSDVYRFDCEVEVLGAVLTPPRRGFPQPVPTRVAAHR